MTKYLVFGATGQQGGATIDALLSKQGVAPSDVFGVTRNPDSESTQKKITSKGVTAVKGDLSSKDSVKEAIQQSKANVIWFMTDFFAAGSAKAETQQGENVVDAIKECGDQVTHVVYSSVGDADNCPKNIEHFWSKAAVEEYMAEKLGGSKCSWAVIRPVAFLDNMDSPAQRNPLVKGKVTGLMKPKTSLKQIAVADIGKASAVMLQDPKTFAGTKLEAAGCQHTGNELAEILTKVSGTPCKYKMMPRWLLWLFMRDVYHMSRWFDASGYTADIDEFKKVVPDAMDASDWFKAKGQWSDGEKFASLSDN